MTLEQAHVKAIRLSELIEVFNEECSQSEHLDVSITKHVVRANTQMAEVVHTIEDKQFELFNID